MGATFSFKRYHTFLTSTSFTILQKFLSKARIAILAKNFAHYEHKYFDVEAFAGIILSKYILSMEIICEEKRANL